MLRPVDVSVFEFRSVRLDLAKGRLFRDGVEVPLRPKSMALLTHMAQNAGRVLSKDELISAVWPDVTVTEDSLTQCIRDVRKALGPEEAALLRTVPKRGYLFDLPPEAAQVPPEAPLRPDGIVVVPLAITSSDDPAVANLALGLVEDVINRLSTLRGLHVISLGSALAALQAAGDPRSIGKALGVLYVVSGSLELRANRVRLRVEISEAQGGGMVWTGEYSEDRATFLELVSSVTAQVANSLHRQVLAAEARRALALPAESLDAWESFHAGLPCLMSTDPATLDVALERFRAAAALSPGFARAWSGQSAVHYVRVMSGLTKDAAADMLDARRTALKAVELDREDPFSHFCISRCLWLAGDVEGARQAAERCVTLSPSFAVGHYELGLIEALQGDPRRAIAELELFQSLSPFDPTLGSGILGRAFAHYRLGEQSRAVQLVRDALRQSYVFASIHVPAALILADCGHPDEARSIVADLLAVAPYPGAEAMRQVLSRQSPVLAGLFDKHAAEIGLG